MLIGIEIKAAFDSAISTIAKPGDLRMTMETYRWQRIHLTTPQLTVAVMRSLPAGDWIVRAEDWTLPPQLPTKYDTLERAMQAADEAARTERNHDCRSAGCGKWTPVPPTSE